MKNFIKILGVTALTALFVACGGAEVSFAPPAQADEPAGTAGQAAGDSCMCQPGAKGDKGDQGPAGAQGAPGKDGASVVCVNDLDSCPPGVAGAQGPAGPAGPQGPKGEAGLDGADGKNGAAGPTGPMGPQGPVGPAGPMGQQGQPGPKGVDGKDGLSISKGSLYVSVSGLAAADAIAYCNDENDIVLSGTCTGQGIFWGVIGPYQPANPDMKSGWECKASNVGGNPVSSTAVCLVVP